MSSLASHPQREQLDADIAAGTFTETELAAKYSTSRASVRRYRFRHLRLLVSNMLQHEEQDGDTIVERLVAVADDLRAARRFLRDAGQISAATNAAAQESRVLGQLAAHIDLDDDLTEFLHEGRAVARVIHRLVARSPKIAPWLAEQFSELKAEGMAEAIRNQARKIETETKS